MNGKQGINQLKEEGFSHIYTHEDSPNAYYPNHAHLTLTAHIIVEGEIALTSEGKTKTYKKGERVDVPKNTVHSAKIGPNGCTYIIGEK